MSVGGGGGAEADTGKCPEKVPQPGYHPLNCRRLCTATFCKIPLRDSQKIQRFLMQVRLQESVYSSTEGDGSKKCETGGESASSSDCGGSTAARTAFSSFWPLIGGGRENSLQGKLNYDSMTEHHQHLYHEAGYELSENRPTSGSALDFQYYTLVHFLRLTVTYATRLTCSVHSLFYT